MSGLGENLERNEEQKSKPPHHIIDTVYQQGLETEVTHVISLYKFPI